MPCDIPSSSNSQEEIVQETETIYNTLINDNISILFNISGDNENINLIDVNSNVIDEHLKK